MKKTLSLIICAVCVFLAASARDIQAHRGEISGGYNFWFSPPENTSTAKPLVVFLHGKSLCGNNLNQVKRYGTIDALERGREIDAYVVAPQNPGGAWNPKKIMDVVEWAQKHGNIDANRIYVLGMSLGGSGTINFTAEYPDKIAAALAMCGGGYSKRLGDLNKVPLWIVHGLADTAVPISQSDNIVSAMKETDSKTPRLVYERVPGVNHSMPARMFYLPEVYEWLFKHSLKEKGRPLHQPSVKVSTDLLGRAYQGLRGGSNYTPVKKSAPAKNSKASKKGTKGKNGKAAKNEKKGKDGKKAAGKGKGQTKGKDAKKGKGASTKGKKDAKGKGAKKSTTKKGRR